MQGPSEAPILAQHAAGLPSLAGLPPPHTFPAGFLCTPYLDCVCKSGKHMLGHVHEAEQHQKPEELGVCSRGPVAMWLGCSSFLRQQLQEKCLGVDRWLGARQWVLRWL